MGFISEKLTYMTQIEFLIFTLVILIVLFLVYVYLMSREKKKLRGSVDNNLKAFQQVCNISEDAIMILSSLNKVLYANSTMVKLLQFDTQFLSKKLETKAEIKVKNAWVSLDRFIEEKRLARDDTILSFPKSQIRFSKNDAFPINFYMDTIQINIFEEEISYIVTIQDLSRETEHSRTHLRHQLTNLPNQLQAYYDLPAFFSKAHLEKNKLGLILLHLDNFSMLRSIIGYEQANDVVKKFARYLETIGADLNLSIYHTFDNHFMLTVTNVQSIEDAKKFLEDIQRNLASFYKMEDVNLHLTVSAGVALYPDSGSIRKLHDNAYKALAQAEKEGDGKIYIFLPEKFSSNYDELRLHNDMKSGLNNGEFEVYYQPIIEVKTKEVTAAEALIRWKHPQYGLIPPDVFISLMEKTGFIVKLGQFVLEEVLKQQKRWELFKFKQIEVSINVSMVEINTGQFVQHVERKLAEHQINPQVLKFEITEGLAMSNESETVKYFLALKKLGVGISLDDFGTGYTSFGYLKKFPADNLKIDKSLVDYIVTNEEDQRIVKAMIELAHTLGMEIVVEGIENKKMVELIASYGCDYMQGYYFSKPIPVFEFQKLLR
ncbi:MAG: GGDEF domain-containing phosphodiesterase [Campylobacterota bacterium]|nr:GGDEF domain-containing phosphodiesterase [Campylobacterota bacterium]